MGERTNARLVTDDEDGRRHAAAHDVASSFGQTTEFRGQAGQVLKLTFEARRGGRVRAEIFYLGE